MTEDDRIDFSAPEASLLEALVRDIDTRCAPMLAERRRRPTTIQIVAWGRPLLAAALLIALASSIALLRTPLGRSPAASALASGNDVTARAELASLLGVPAPLVRRVTIADAPTLSDLMQETAP